MERAIRLTLLLWLAAVGLARGAGAVPAAPNPVNPSLARSYKQIALVDLREDTPDVERAVQSLNGLLKRDPSNALPHYLLAHAHALTGDWDGVTGELKRGNAAPYCVHYQFVDGPANLTPAFAALRRLARACAAGAADQEVEKGTALLREVRRMGKKAAATEPRSLLGLLAGHSLRTIADKGLVEYFAARSAPGLAEAKKIQTADAEFRKRMVADLQAKIGEPDAAIRALAKKHSVTIQEVAAASEGGSTPAAAARAKLAAMKRELDAKEAPLVSRWLKEMPD